MPSAAVIRHRLASAAPVGLGLLVLGVSAYVVLGIAGHSLDPSQYAAFASLYLLVAIVGPGVFVAVEQETNREVSSRLASGSGIGSISRSSQTAAAVLAVVVLLLLLVTSPLLVPRVFGGSWALLLALAFAVVGTAAVYVQRGMFAGTRRYRWYAVSLAGEGLSRIILATALLLAGAAGAVSFGFAFAAGAAITAALCLPARHGRGDDGPPIDVRVTATRTFQLAFASGLTFLVTNAAPLVLTSRLPEQPELAASFVSLFVLARIPVFLFAPLQMFLLPGLTEAAERRDPDRYRSRLLTALLAVGLLGLPAAAVSALVGPWAARIFFNAPVDLPPLAAGLLGLSTVAMMASQVLQPALVAAGNHRMATLSWIAGSLLFAGMLFLPGDPVAAAVAAQLGAPLGVCLFMGVAVWKSIARMKLPAQSTDRV